MTEEHAKLLQEYVTCILKDALERKEGGGIVNAIYYAARTDCAKEILSFMYRIDSVEIINEIFSGEKGARQED